MSRKLTRRDLAAAFAAAAPLFAQSQPAAKPTPQEELRAGIDDLNASGKKLSAFEVPMATEPAFQFKA